MLRVALLLLVVVAASAVNCSVTCDNSGPSNGARVTHDTTSGHTHHRCYTSDLTPGALVCTCECCNSVVDGVANDCSIAANFFPADTDCVGHFTTTMYVHTTLQAGTGAACPYTAGTANLCSCNNGIAATCTTNSVAACASCTGNYQLSGAGTCVCTGNYHLDGSACVANVCTCDNGNAVANSACTSHDTSECASCTGNFQLSGAGTCVCPAYYHLSAGTCVANVCTCDNGNAVANSACTSHDANECASCNAKSYGSLGNGVEGNQCTVCPGNDGNVLGCVNGDHHRCTTPGGDGTMSSTPVWCDHCNAKSYGSLGTGVEGNQCTVCPGNDGNVLGCVNGDYHRCTSPGGDGTMSSTPVWCDHCNTKSYGSLGNGVEGNQCTVCEGNDNNAIGCVNGDYHRCTSPGGDGTKTAGAGYSTPLWCDHCTPGSTWGGGGSLGHGVEGNQCQ